METEPVPVGIKNGFDRPSDFNYKPITRDPGFDAGRRLPEWIHECGKDGLYISKRFGIANMWNLRYADRDLLAPYAEYMDDFHAWADTNDQLVNDLGYETYQFRMDRQPSLHWVMSIVSPDVRRPDEPLWEPDCVGLAAVGSDPSIRPKYYMYSFEE